MVEVQNLMEITVKPVALKRPGLREIGDRLIEDTLYNKCVAHWWTGVRTQEMLRIYRDGGR